MSANFVHNTVLMGVKTCLKAFLALCGGHGKSLCFLQVVFCGWLVRIAKC